MLEKVINRKFVFLSVLLAVVSIFAIAAVGLSSSSAYAGQVYQPRLQNGVDALRFAGDDRYETNSFVDLYPNFVPSDLDCIIVCSGDNAAWPDSLCANSFTSRTRPIVLVDGKADSLSYDNVAVINTLLETGTSFGRTDIFVIGGESSVSEGIYNALKLYDSDSKPERIAGADRYETALLLAVQLNHYACENMFYTNNIYDQPVVVSGENFADALSVGSYCAYTGRPILLYNPIDDGLLIKTFLPISQNPACLIVGGESSVPTSFENWLEDIPGISSSNIKRIAGADRYETNINFISWAVDEGCLLDSPIVGFASGSSFPDALSSNMVLCYPHMGWAAPLVLLDPVDNSHNSYAYNFLYNLPSSISMFVCFGGEKSVPESTYCEAIAAGCGLKVSIGGVDNNLADVSYAYGISSGGRVCCKLELTCNFGYAIEDGIIYVRSPSNNRYYLDAISVNDSGLGTKYTYEFELDFDDPGVYTVVLQGASLDYSTRPDWKWEHYYQNWYNGPNTYTDYFSSSASTVSNEPNKDGSWTVVVQFNPKSGYSIYDVKACSSRSDDTFYYSWGIEKTNHNWNLAVDKISSNRYAIIVPYGVEHFDVACFIKDSNSASTLSTDSAMDDFGGSTTDNSGSDNHELAMYKADEPAY